MPRRRPRTGSRTARREPGGPGAHRPRVEVVEEAGDGDWVVRAITGAATGKSYRCPGCDQEIRPGTPHVVTWPAYARNSDLEPWDVDSAADRRRHWHSACWRSRSRRR